MNDTVRFVVLACVIVFASVYWLVRRSNPQGIGRGVPDALRQRTSAGLAVGVPAAVVALYLHFGDFAALTGRRPTRSARWPRSGPTNSRAGSRPGLATSPVSGCSRGSYEQLGQMQQAVRTRERLVALRPDDVDALVDLADTLSLAQGGNYVGEPIATVRRALTIDAANARALAAIANEAAERGDLATAIASWERIEAQVPSDSEVGRSLRADIEGARSELAARASTASEAGVPPVVKAP